MHNLWGKWETKRHSMDIHCCYEYVVPNKKDSYDATNDNLIQTGKMLKWNDTKLSKVLGF